MSRMNLMINISQWKHVLHTSCCRICRFWRCQRGNQNLFIEDEHAFTDGYLYSTVKPALVTTSIKQ